MYERNAFGLVGQLEHPVECRVTTAENDEPFARKLCRIAHAVVQRLVLVLLDIRHPQLPRLERADPGSDHHGFRVELLALARLDEKRVVILAPHDLHFLAQVHPGRERLDLFQERIGQFLPGAHGNRRDIVDRLVGIQLGALPSGSRYRVDDLGLEAQQAEFEDLEQAAGTCADDDDVCVDQVGTPFLSLVERPESL